MFGEDLFFGLHLICSPEKNRDRGSSPPMLRKGKNWGKIAKYPPPPQCSTKIYTPGSSCTVIALFALMLAVQYTHGVLCFFLSAV